MSSGPGRAGIVCVAGVDEASTAALARARRLQRAFRCPVRAVFVTKPWPGIEEHLDEEWFSGWALRQAGLCVAPEDVQVVPADRCAAAVGRLGIGADHALIVPAERDSSTEAAFLSRPLLWACAARAGALLIVARPPQPTSRVLLARDGTFESLALLRLALELSEQCGGELDYFESHAMRLSRPHVLLRATPLPAACVRSPRRATSERTPLGGSRAFASALARAGLERGADLIVLSVAAGAEQVALELARIAPCSVLLVPSRDHACRERPRAEMK